MLTIMGNRSFCIAGNWKIPTGFHRVKEIVCLSGIRFVGLTMADIDFEDRKIKVSHQLQRKRNMEYIIEDTKTSSGTHEVPMSDEVYEAFSRMVKKRRKPKKEPKVGKYKGFLYLDKNDMPMVALHWKSETI